MRVVSFFAVILILAGIALREQGQPPTPVCFQVTGGQAMTVKGTYWGEALGTTIREVAALSDDEITEETFNAYKDRLAKNVLRLWWKSFWDAGHGRPLDPQILQLREEQKRVEAEAAATCAAEASALCAPDTEAPSTDASIPRGNLKGPDLAADALRKAAPEDAKWLAEIPLGVAIAELESSFIPTASNNVNTGHVGFWQISGANAAHFKLGDRNDPYDNARYAYALWKGRGGTWSMDWTVYKTALARQDKYARYGAPVAAGGGGGMVAAAGVAPAPVDPRAPLRQDGESFTPDDSCSAGGAPGGVSVGTWNVLYTNSSANVTRGAGFADLVGLQEIRGKHRPIRVPGYRATPGGMAVPIIWRTSKLELVRWDREETVSGRVHKWVVYGVWRVKATGQEFAAVNTHQYVNGGPLWDDQARNVERVRRKLAARYPTYLLGDMNASNVKIRTAFGSAGVGGRIDKIIGPKLGKAEQLSAFGSDHHRYRATIPGPAPVASAALTSDPSGRTTMDGKAISRVVAAQILLAERESGINFTVMQGGFGGGDVPASGTSHDWPGVVDLSPGTVAGEEALRRAGFASWARNIPGRSYAGSGAHNHAVSLLDPGNKGHGQLSAWERGENGLNGGKDPAPHYPWYPALNQLGAQ